MKSELFFNDKKYIRCSENSIQAILIAQELARREESKFVELQHILGGLKQNKKSYAGKLLNKLNIAIHEKNFNSYYINSSIKKSSYDEIPLSESSRNIIQKALQESKNHLKYRFYLRSIHELITSFKTMRLAYKGRHDLLIIGVPSIFNLFFSKKINSKQYIDIRDLVWDYIESKNLINRSIKFLPSLLGRLILPT